MTCPNCKTAKALLERSGIEYETVDAEENAELSMKFRIHQAPTLVAISGDSFEVFVGVGGVNRFIREQTEKAVNE